MMFKTVLCIIVLVLAVSTAQIVPNNYIVVFKENTLSTVVDRHLQLISSLTAFTTTGSLIKNRWSFGDFSGYSAKLFSPLLVNLISASQDVLSVEPDQIVRINACGSQSVSGGLWGLNRITTNSRSTSQPYLYNTKAGFGTNNYVIDTGILTTHTEFGGRAREGVSFVPDEPTSIDYNGHGTHCAGTIGGRTVGVAKNATLIAVKVLGRNGQGLSSGVIDGINWVARNYSNQNPRRPSTANLSLGGGFSRAVNNAVNSLARVGVFVAVAAGNENQTASNSSPASAASGGLIVSVGATTNTDVRASFSNWGQNVTLFAPGQGILSAWVTSNSSGAVLSGTSMASPHVAGVAALYLSVYTNATGAQARSWLVGRANQNARIADLQGSPNKLLYQGCY